MKHFLLKFNHGVEIGARLAYLGHFERTRILKINQIAHEELMHMHTLETILRFENEVPSPTIDYLFYVIGHFIKWNCRWCPLWSLDLVARSMEIFAISNYTYLSKVYPAHGVALKWMAIAEMDHEEYFRLGPVVYENLDSLRRGLIGVSK